MKQFLKNLGFTALGFVLACAILLSSTAIFAASTSVVGDVNADGKVNPLDVAILARHIAGWIGYETLPYGVEPEDETTTFVITATPRQRFYIGIGGTEYNSASDEIGVQKLTGGVPQGEVLYIPCADLGITADEIENYINYSVILTNFDETDGSYEGCTLGNAPTVITHEDVSYASDNTRFIIEGKTYTATKEMTGASLMNEICIYDSTGVPKGEKMLLLNTDGDIIDSKGNILAVFAYESSVGAIYYLDTSSGNSQVITESTALDRYGVYAADTTLDLHTHTPIITDSAEGDGIDSTMYDRAYNLTLFDDDNNGKYDRAFFDPIYMSVYDTYEIETDDESIIECDGLIKNAYGIENIAASDVVYTDEDAQLVGAVSVFTYNKQLNTVSIIDVLEPMIDKVNKIDATQSASGIYRITLGETTYLIGHAGDNGGDGALMGATLVPYNDSDDMLPTNQVESVPFIQYISDIADFINNLKIGTSLKFYAYNEVLIYTVDSARVSNNGYYTVVNEFADFDLAKVYLDLYINGELNEEVLVTGLDGKVFEDLSSYKFSMLLSEKEYFYPGTIYNYSVNESSEYILREIIDDTNYSDYWLFDGKLADDAYAEALGTEAPATTGTIEFSNGTTVGNTENAIVTDSSTVFYFIENAECSLLDGCIDGEHDESCAYLDLDLRTVTPIMGSPASAYISFNADASIWVDALGTATDGTSLVASVVFVINPTDHSGFFASEDTVYVLTNLTTQYAEVDSAEGLGMPLAYSGVYYKYTNCAINMNTGDRITIYSKVKLAGNRIYKVDENGVVYLEDTNNFTGTLMDAPSQDSHYGTDVNIHWMQAPVVDSSDGYKNYVAYGITDVNGAATSVTSSAWGKPDGKVNYNDFVWYTKANTKERNAALDDYAAELAALVNTAIDAGAEDVDVSTIVNSNGNQAAVKAFLKPYVAEGKKIEADDIEFMEIPTKNYEEIELVTHVLYAEYVDDYLTIELLTNTSRGVKADTYLIDENDRITDLIVVSANSIGTKWTGEDAVKILNTAPQVAWIGAKGAGSIYGELFDEYIKDGSIVIAVLWQHADK